MTISELIVELEAIRTDEGDIPCYQHENYGIDNEPEWHPVVARVRRDWVVDSPYAVRLPVCVCFGSYSAIDVEL